MKKLILLLLFIPIVSFGQNNKGVQMCLALQSNGFISNLEAEEALDLIMNVSGLNKNFILAPCDNIENAFAIRFNNERYIIYDKDFMDEIDGESKWRNLTILAHEVAHHLNNHPLEVRLANSTDRKSFAEKRRQELEADEFAGFIMARLDGPLEEVLAAISSISNNKDDTYSTHPSRDKRINAIKKGYKRAGYKENSSWFNWEVPDFFKKIQNIFFGEAENKTEEIKVEIKEQKQKANSSSKNFKYTTTDFYIDNFNKNPDYGNYKDLSSYAASNDTWDMLYKGYYSVLNGGKKYGKLNEGLSYANKAIELYPSDRDSYDDRAEINFYLGNHNEALNDSNKSLEFYDSNDLSKYGDYWMIMFRLDVRSKIKYMLGDYSGAINDLQKRINYFSKDNGCIIEDYYFLTIYYLTSNDNLNAKFYFNKVKSFPSNGNCGTRTIPYWKSKANKLNAYIIN